MDSSRLPRSGSAFTCMRLISDSVKVAVFGANASLALLLENGVIVEALRTIFGWTYALGF